MKIAFACCAGALLLIGSCYRDEWPFPFPERCLQVAGDATLQINDTLRLPDSKTSEFWIALATAEGTWAIDLENTEYIVSFHRGVSPLSNDEMNTFTNEEWKEAVETRCSHSLKGGFQNEEGRLWLLVAQPDGSDLLLG